MNYRNRRIRREKYIQNRPFSFLSLPSNFNLVCSVISFKHEFSRSSHGFRLGVLGRDNMLHIKDISRT